MNKSNFTPVSPAQNSFLKQPLKKLRLWLLLFSMAGWSVAHAQLPNTGQIQFLPDTVGFLGLDRNGNTVDLSNEQYIIAPGSQSVNSTVINLPFNVYFFGAAYTSFVVNVNGCMVLTPSASVAFTANIANNYTSVNSQYAVLAPFWDVLSTPANKGIRYVVSGTAPYRSLAIEWVVKSQNQVTAVDYDMQFQLRLYESTNIVEYVYGRMRIGNTLSVPVTASVGFSTSSASRDSSFISLMNTDSFYVTRIRSDLAGSQNLVNKSTPGNIKGLHSETEGRRTRIAFVPYPILLPGNLSAFNITANEALLYWDDNSDDETGFRTHRVKPGELEYDTTVAPNISFRTLTGLLPATTYQYRVQAYNNYTTAYSNVVTFRTSDADTITAKASGNWSDTATWGGLVPGRNTIVNIPSGYTVMADLAQAYCHQLKVEGGLVFADNALAKKLNVNYDVINSGRIIANPNPTYNSLANEIVTGRSVINSGTLDLYQAQGSYTSAVTLRFTGDDDARLTGNGDTTDLYAIVCAKKYKNDSITINPKNLSVKNAATDVVSAGALLSGTIHTGILYIGGTFVLENRLLASNTFDTETNKGFSFILDNPNFTIKPVAGDVALKSACSLLLKKGLIDIRGSLVVSALATLNMEGGTLNIAGQLKNLANNQAITFIQTGGVISTNGMAMNAPSNILNLQGGLLISNGNSQLLGDVSVSRFGNHITQFGLSNGQPVKQFNVSGSYAGIFIDSTVNTPAIVKLVLDANMSVSKKLYIGDNDTIDAGNFQFTVYSDSITVDGNFKSNAAGKLTFASLNKQVLSGNGKIKAATLEVAKDETATPIILNTANAIEATNLNLFGGQIVNSRKLSIGAAGIASAIRIARDNTTSQGGSLDTFPVYAVASNLYIYYNNEPAQRTTAYEIPAGRTVAGFFFNNAQGITISGGNIEVTDTLVMASGKINTSENSYIQFTDTTNDRALYVAAGTYFNGPFARKIATVLPAGKAYVFPVGAATNKPLMLSDLAVQNSPVLLRAWYKDSAATGATAADVRSLDSAGFWQLAALNNTPALTRFVAGIYDNNLTSLSQFVLAKSNSPVLGTTDVFARAGSRVNYYTDSLKSIAIIPAATPDTFYYFAKAELVPGTFTKSRYTIGQGGDFETLTEVAAKLGTTLIDSSVVFEITQEYNTDKEIFPIGFERLLYTNSTHPKNTSIRLAKNVTGIVTSNFSKPVLTGYALINFYGADSLELNGMGYDGLGLPTGINEWTLKTGPNAALTPVVRFVNDASYNTIRSVNITGNNSGTASGTIVFDAAAKEITGNDGNTITQSTITSESSTLISYSHITSKGSAGTVRNDATAIINNRIADFSGMGINVAAGAAGSDWKVENNHIYQTFVSAFNAVAINFIPGAGSGRNSFKANTIGGSAPNAAGTAWTFSGAAYQSLLVFNTDASEETVVSDNIIKNYNQNNNGTASGLRAITTLGGNNRVVANKIGGADAAEVITIAGRGLSSMIQSSGNTGKFTATDNIITNINQSVAASTTNRVRAISIEGTAPASVINNTITNITGRGANTDHKDASLVGIYVSGISPSVNISGNTLSNLNMASTGCVTAVSINSAANGQITANNIYNITNASTGTTRYIMGVNVEGGSWILANNKIVITNAGNNTLAIGIQALRIASGPGPKSMVLHNTVYVGGTTSINNVTTSASYAYVQATANADVTIRNNLFINTRGSVGAIHMAAYVVASNAMKSDFNVFYSPTPNAAVSVSGVAGTFDTYKTAYPGNDLNSVAGKLPAFKGIPENIFLADTAANCFIKGMGTAAATAPADYSGIARSATQPDPGADEFTYTAGLPTAPVLLSGNETLCSGLTRTLYVAQPAQGSDIEWFNVPSGGKPLFTGVDFTTGAITRDTAFYIQLKSGECKSYRTRVAVNVKPAPSLVVLNAPLSPICGGNTLTLKASPAAGSTIQWFTDSMGGASIATGEQFITGVLNNDTVFYAEASNGICPSVRIKVAVNVDSNIVLLPPVTDTLVHACRDLTVQLKASSPYNINWYEAGSGIIISNDSILEVNDIPGDTYFYVTATNGSCESEQVKVTVITDAMSELPVLDSIMNVCGSTPFDVKLNATGTTYWFTGTDTSELPFFTGSELNIPGLAADSIFYFEVMNGVCPRSGRGSVLLRPTLVADPVVDAVPSVCKNTTATLTVLNTVNETANWYTSINAATPVYSGSQFITNALAADTSFYVAFTENGCAGTRVPVAVAVVASAAAPVLVAADSVCKGSAAKLVVNTAGQVSWYATALATDAISNDPEFNTGLLASDTIFYAAAAYGSCLSERIAVKVTLKAAPQPPLFAPVQNICSGTSARLEATASDSVKWYATTNSTNPVNRGNVFNTPKLANNITYYLETENGSCKSKRVALAVPVLPAPQPPVVSELSYRTCFNEPVLLKANSAVAVNWYASKVSPVLLQRDSVYVTERLSIDTVFYAESFDGLCRSERIAIPVTVLNYIGNLQVLIPDSAIMGAEISISSNGPQSSIYSWEFGSGASLSGASGQGPFRLTYNTAGDKDIKVLVTRRSGALNCDTLIIKHLNVIDTTVHTGLAPDKEVFASFTIYPNPANDVLNITSALKKAGNVNVQLCDATGRVVWENVSDQTTDYRQAIDISAYQSGLYLIRAMSNGAVQTKKVIIE